MIFKLLSTALIFTLLTSLAMADKVVVGYFPNWLGERFPVSSIDFSSYTHIHYAFAIMVSGNVPEWTDPASVDTQLNQLVESAHGANSKVLLSLGGWTGSNSFRKEFIDWNVEQITKYKTDGVDIDWEYPGRQGAGCNAVDDQNDVSNLLTLLQELRSALDSAFDTHKEISIAGYSEAFKTETGAASNDVTAAIGKVIDRVNIMSYDINGAWNNQTGPNSPLDAPNGGISFNSAIDAWISAGIPANKLTGGLPFYGRSTFASEDMTKSGSIYQGQESGDPPKGDSDDAEWQDPNCAKSPSSLSGIWKFGNLMSQGVLDTPTTAKSPWVRTWDKGSSTPWLFNPSTKVFISYDDPLSIAAKVKSASSKGLAGVMVWSVDEDSEGGDLLKAITQNN
ncbi:glycoside hydrolase family 18 protein [Mucor lusitanicus]|uniref:Glycoside hydrolase family 18 protein n=1 Tax=Mucor circinelloides f. lusitanicus TaxID=29924 RepID=A0A8H4BEH8_MUCCL|nr:glycoside hydrolase family 18 protein [Mucor lusitanicus]